MITLPQLWSDCLHDPQKTIRIGAFDNSVSRWHASHVQKALKKKHRSHSFECVFHADLKAAAKAGAIDFAVWDFAHPSAKTSHGFAVGAMLKRQNPGDALLSRDGYTLETLPTGATVATNNLRSRGQLLFTRKDLKIKSVELSTSEKCDAVVAPYEEIRRLGREDAISELLGYDFMLPEPGEGGVVVQCLRGCAPCAFTEPLHDEKTHLAVLAESSYLHGLGTNKDAPVAAFAAISRKTMTLAGAVIACDGSEKHLLQTTIDLPQEPMEARKTVSALGKKLAKIALEDGAQQLMEVRS